MFHPVGPQPPQVYWRRRLTLLGGLALVIVLIVLTVKIAASDSGRTAADGAPLTPGPTGTLAATKSSTGAPSTARPSTPRSSRSSSVNSSSRPVTSSGRSSSSTPQPCAPGQLAIQAVVGKSNYRVGDKPLLELQVTNTGAAPCVQDLADKQVVLKVYNGESRVWGSHDCQIQPGVTNRTLAVNQPVRVAITWSGLSSQPNCAGTRQRVGPGTYTLYAELSGKTGKATQFTLS